MATVKMPQLGESITEGTISKWLKKPGEQVKKYESLVEVITDKVNAEVPAPFGGVLKEIKVQEGTTVSVGTEIAVIEEAGAAQQPAPRAGGGGREATAPPSEGLGGHAGMVKEPMAGPPREVTLAGRAEQSAGRAEESSGGRARLSPAVRALIEEHRISDAELGRIEGSGIGGRISKKDVESYLARRGEQPPRDGEQRPSRPEEPAVRRTGEATPAAAAVAGRGEEPIALSPMRRAIAANMTRSKQTIPHAWTVTEVDMSNVVRIRQAARQRFRQQEGVDLSFVPIVAKGVVEQLRANPALNAGWAEDKIQPRRDINLGIAVSIDEGLIVPVIKNADRLSVAGLAKAADELAQRARAGKLTLDDVQGATFTLNNPGTFGTILSYSIIPPGQAAILVMDAIVKRPVVVEGDAIAVRSMMNLCLSFDHRVLDGVTAARFLQGLRRWLEGFSEQIPLY